MSEPDRAPPPRGRPRSDSARTGILAAAYDLVVEHGYGAVTTAQIAARAGSGKQTIYRWWPSKSALVLDALERAAGSVADPYPPALPAYLASLCRTSLLTAPVLRSLLAQAQSDPDLLAMLKARLLAPRRTALAARLDAIGHAAGPAREALVDAIEGALWYRLLAGEPLDDAFVDAMVCLAEGTV